MFCFYARSYRTFHVCNDAEGEGQYLRVILNDSSDRRTCRPTQGRLYRESVSTDKVYHQQPNQSDAESGGSGCHSDWTDCCCPVSILDKQWSHFQYGIASLESQLQMDPVPKNYRFIHLKGTSFSSDLHKHQVEH